jgi:ribosomal protein L14E/L6E/L27E
MGKKYLHAAGPTHKQQFQRRKRNLRSREGTKGGISDQEKEQKEKWGHKSDLKIDFLKM